MIEIKETDLPITVAEKLINATCKMEDASVLGKIALSLNALGGGDGTFYAFDVDELVEIAEHLMCYCEHHKQLEEKQSEE